MMKKPNGSDVQKKIDLIFFIIIIVFLYSYSL